MSLVFEQVHKLEYEEKTYLHMLFNKCENNVLKKIKELMIDYSKYYELKEYDIESKDRDLPLKIFEEWGVQFDKGESPEWDVWADC